MHRWLTSVVLVALGSGIVACSNSSDASEADDELEQALDDLVGMPEGPPGVIVVVQRGSDTNVHTAGVAELGTTDAPDADDHMRLASAAKAYSGATAMSLVDRGVMSLDDTIGQRLPDMPEDWHPVTLGQLLAHTSGLPNFTDNAEFRAAVTASVGTAPPPQDLLTDVEDEPLVFPPGSRYVYSNSDNIAAGLMIAAATGGTYEDALAAEVLDPLGLDETSLPSGPELPDPFMHGYQFLPGEEPEDVSEVFASGWAWASGGVVSTPNELNEFIRGYVGGELFDESVQDDQRRWIPGATSEPPGPGANSAGLSLFRYQTRCGTVFGHTGNTFGYTQFAAATPDGQRSTTVSISLQRTQNSEEQAAFVFEALRRAEEAAVCAALA